jgi:hypothetical protein
VNVAALNHKESAVMNDIYQTENPLLTCEMEENIRQSFHARWERVRDLCESQSGGQYDGNAEEGEGMATDEYAIPSLDLQEAYEVMFSGEERLCYTMDLFIEDLMQFERTDPSKLTVDEAVAFIHQMQ